MAISAAQERRVGIEQFVVLVIVESFSRQRIHVALDARFVLNGDDNRCGLARETGGMLDRVPGGERKNLRASDESLAAVTINAFDFFFAMMEGSQVGRVALRDRARVSRQIFRFGLGVARPAEIIVLLEMTRVAFAAN